MELQESCTKLKDYKMLFSTFTPLNCPLFYKWEAQQFSEVICRREKIDVYKKDLLTYI